MAFTSTAHFASCLTEKAVPTKAGWYIATSVGFDDLQPLTYYFFAGTYISEGSTEFVFGLRPRNNLKCTYEPTIFDAREVRRLIGSDHNARHNEILTYFTETLIATSNPSHYFMRTFNSHLLPKALVKYERLCGVFRKLGYRVTPSLTSSMKHQWTMNKIV